MKFKIYEEFLQKLEEYNIFFIDLVKIYKSYNFVVPPNAPEIPIGDIPNEILLLKYIFQGIKHINLNLNKMAKNNILPFIIIILNADWLFPFVFEVDMDFRYETFQNDINNLYLTNEKLFYINYLKNKPNNYEDIYLLDDNNDKDGNINYEEIIGEPQILNLIKNDFDKSNDPFIKEKLFDNNNNINNTIENDSNLIRFNNINENYTNLLIKNENTFDVILCFFYLIKKIKYLKTLNITMPNGFIKENIELIKIRNILEIESYDISNIDLFEYISTISSINSFNITFNCLEKKTFENVLFIIQNNYNLYEIKLDFFPNDAINSQNLIKISEECGILNDLNLEKYQKNIIMNKRIEKILKGKLLELFEINLEKLFLLFQTKKNLEKLEIIIKLPNIFLSKDKENEKYYLVIIKFIFNLIILLHEEKLNLKEFIIKLPFFNFDNRTYPVISEVFEKINLLRKNPQLKVLIFEIPIFKIYNIQNLISINLQNLQIGELDLETFNNFIQFYQSKEFLQNSQLRILNISLNKTMVKYKDFKNSLFNFFSGKNPIYLTEITFKCYFRIKRKNLYDLLKSTNGNKIQTYNFIMKIDKLKKYKHIMEHKELYFKDNEIEEKIISYLPLLKKYNFLQEKYKKITKNIIKFLVPSNRKNINIIDIKS